jgi:hypothetical protein
MPKDLDYIVNHVFFPPKLPQKDDSNVKNDDLLIEELLAALKLFQSHITGREYSEWIPCVNMISNMLELRDHMGGLVAEKMETKLREMIYGGTIELTSGDETGF